MDMPAEINVSAPMMYSDGISTVLSLLFLKAAKKKKNELKAMVIKLQFM